MRCKKSELNPLKKDSNQGETSPVLRLPGNFIHRKCCMEVSAPHEKDITQTVQVREHSIGNIGVAR
jgi:hypothetical protein